MKENHKEPRTDLFDRPREEIYGVGTRACIPTAIRSGDAVAGLVADCEQELYVIAKLSTNLYAIAAEIVEGVTTFAKVHPLPISRGGAGVGVVNYRGRVIPAISLRNLLGESGGGSEGRGIIVRTGRGLVAVLVETTLGAVRLSESSMAVSTHPGLVRATTQYQQTRVGVVVTETLCNSIGAQLW